MTNRKYLAALIAALLSCNNIAVAQTSSGEQQTEEDDASAEEEVITIGTRRVGDYSFITEDTEKLVETAGSLGDPLAAVFALPGVVYANGQEPAVRGSSPADNVYVVDFLPAVYIFHDFGTSVFSEFVLHDFQLYSAGFGPEYSNATGAAFDVALRNPENKPLETTLDLSMLRSGVFMEGGVTDSSAFYLSYRKSLIHLFIPEDEEVDDGIVVQQAPEDYDYQVKYAWDVNDNNRLTFSANGAADQAAASLDDRANFVASNPDFAGDAEIDDKYVGQYALYEYFGDNGTEAKLGFANLDNKNNLFWGDGFDNNTSLKQKTYKGRISAPVGDLFRIAFGSEFNDQRWEYYLDQVLFVCTEFDTNCDQLRRERFEVEDGFNIRDTSSYVDGTWMPSDNFTLDIGVQYQQNDYTDESFTHPRIAAALKVSDSTTLTAKAGTYNRLSDLGNILPEYGNPNLKSPTSNHYTLGIAQDFGDGWSASVEAYYKTLDDLPLALSSEEDVDDIYYINGTEGEARGIDIMVNKNITDKWYGWMSLSYAKSERTNKETGETKEYFLDTPLIFNWVMNYQWTRRFNVGWRWSIRSGQAYTPIVGVQENPFFEDAVWPVYGEAFSERLPMYNRLDIRFKWDFTTFGKESAVILDIINALNHRNVEERDLDFEKVNSVDDPVVTEDTIGLQITPALTYRITF